MPWTFKKMKATNSRLALHQKLVLKTENTEHASIYPNDLEAVLD